MTDRVVGHSGDKKGNQAHPKIIAQKGYFSQSGTDIYM